MAMGLEKYLIAYPTEAPNNFSFANEIVVIWSTPERTNGPTFLLVQNGMEVYENQYVIQSRKSRNLAVGLMTTVILDLRRVCLSSGLVGGAIKR